MYTLLSQLHTEVKYYYTNFHTILCTLYVYESYLLKIYSSLKICTICYVAITYWLTGSPSPCSAWEGMTAFAPCGINGFLCSSEGIPYMHCSKSNDEA